MRAGRLDRSIVIQRSSYVIDDTGNPIFTWVDLTTQRAEIIQASTEEFIRAYGAADETVTIFRIRFFDGITNADRVIYAGTAHNIKEVKEIGRRKGLEIRTVAIGGA